MTIKEFSDQFDVLYNNITSNQAPGLNEYEKSVFLTKAQDEIVKNYFSPNSKGNSLQEGFDGNAKRQIDFSMLMRTIIGTSVTASVNIHFANNTGYYAMPSDILLYINEVLKVKRNGNNVNLTVIPLAYDDYNRLMSKPFKRPLKNQAWRLITSGAASSYTYTDYAGLAAFLVEHDIVTATSDKVYNTIYGKELSIGEDDDEGYHLIVDGTYALKADGTLTTNWAEGANIGDGDTSEVLDFIVATVPASSTVVELIPGNNDTIQQYIIRYVARPTPIILTDLTDEDVSLGGGQTSSQGCTLDPILHEEILQRAVELAKIAWTATGQDNAQMVLQAGQRSE